MKIKDLPKLDRPREKLRNKGSKSLSDFELLLALFGSGNKQAEVTTIARNVLALLKKHGIDIDYKELERIKGMGAAKIAELLAAFELSKRYLVQSDHPIINTAAEAVLQFQDIRDKKQEYFVCVTLDGANLSHPREVFADALAERAANIIVGHNHPSGTLRPSDNDIEITKRLWQSGKLLGIALLDHLILTKDKYFSFADNGLLDLK